MSVTHQSASSIGAPQGANQLASKPRVYAPRYSRSSPPGAVGSGEDVTGAGTGARTGAGVGACTDAGRVHAAKVTNPIKPAVKRRMDSGDEQTICRTQYPAPGVTMRRAPNYRRSARYSSTISDVNRVSGIVTYTVSDAAMHAVTYQ